MKIYADENIETPSSMEFGGAGLPHIPLLNLVIA